MDVAFCFMRRLVLREAVTRLRFASSPLAELALTTMAVRTPQWHPFHSRWLADTEPGRRQVGIDRILLLVNPDRWVLDTLIRHPVRRGASFAQEMAALAQVDARIFRRDLEVLWGRLPREVGRTDTAARAWVLDTVQAYWDHCVAASWPAFKAVLDADVTYRGAELAAHGVATAVSGAIPGFVVKDHDLVMPLRRDPGWEATADERGVTFLPTLVKWGTNVPNLPDSDLVFTYRARGRGRLNHTEVDSRPGLVGILGRTRTELLLSLEEPASSTAVAVFMGVTTTAVNQHLRALARAGLLQTSRFGRYVLYERTALAEDLIAAGG